VKHGVVVLHFGADKNDKGKPVEKQGRKVMGLPLGNPSHDRQTAEENCLCFIRGLETSRPFLFEP
jgi:hypothetical protein